MLVHNVRLKFRVADAVLRLSEEFAVGDVRYVVVHCGSGVVVATVGFDRGMDYNLFKFAVEVLNEVWARE